MKNKITQAAIILIISIFILYFYTFLHEGGHALVGLIAHGKVDKITLGLNARVYMSGASYTPFTQAIFNLAGVLLPVLFLMISLLFYNRNSRNSIYHIFFSLFYIFILGSLLAWLFVPLMSLITLISVGDDISKFITITGVHPIILSSLTIALFCLLLFMGYKKGLFIKIREMLAEPRSEIISGNWSLSLRSSVILVMLGLTLFLAFIFLEKQKGVLSTSFSAEVSAAEEDRMFPFEITKSKVYRMDINLKTKGILIDTQLFNESGQLIYHVIAEQVTLNKSLDLIKGKYHCLLTFMTDPIKMKEHIKVKGYPLEEERIFTMGKIFNDNIEIKHHVDFSAVIR